MNLSPTDQIKGCRSLQELQDVWTTNVDQWSQQLPTDQARDLIRVKDEHKAKLKLFEEWGHWYEERAAIIQFDGGLPREDADREARTRLVMEVFSC